MAHKQYTNLLIILLLIFPSMKLIFVESMSTNDPQSILKERVTKLQLYVQDILSTEPSTTIPVAQPPSTSSSPTLFGLVGVLDDPIWTNPSPDAEIVGRVQGMIAYASLEEISLHMTMDLVFTGGKYNGSSLSVVGHNPYYHQLRSLAVVGGSGDFLFARGLLKVRTVSMDALTGDAFFEYNITLLHY